MKKKVRWVTAVFIVYLGKKTALTHKKKQKKKTAVTQWVTAVFYPALVSSKHFGNRLVRKSVFIF